MKAVGSVLDLIGETPLVRLVRLEPPGSAQVWAKVEGLNPSGSIKDRVALALVREAEGKGLLGPGGVIVESSAGNMGVSLAMVAAARGYKPHLFLPEGVPLERRRLAARYGAELHLTPSNTGMTGANVAANRLLERNPEFVRLDQFASEATVKAHREGTGREILEATQGGVDAFVAGVGSGGTLIGVGQALRRVNPALLLVAVEPTTSPLLSEGRAGEHGILGIGADFVPSILDRGMISEVAMVSTQEAVDMALRLAKEAGLMVGVSSGANVAAALRIAQRLGQGRRVVTVLPDTGERYPHLAREISLSLQSVSGR
ncbi:MAG: cysteine synthase family protein [Chloroflexi bacterium]|nr:cysteine synthase family protein [Chloroflexota bacterium]